MAQKTLLELTQDILSHLSSDEVNSISDTTESLQVATIIKNKYYDIIARSNLPAKRTLVQLTPSTDITLPVLMYIPSDVENIDWIKYFHDDDVADVHQYEYVTIVSREQFLDKAQQLNPDNDNVGTMTLTLNTTDDFTFYYQNDRQPCYCCIIANRYVVFDAYDADLDSTLQDTKTMVSGTKAPTFTMSDTFVPDLNDNEFPLLLNEAKALAFFELKQQQHPLAVQETKRQWSTLQKHKTVNNMQPSDLDRLPDFGHKRGGWTYGFRQKP